MTSQDLKNKLENFYQTSDAYQQMLMSQQEEDFREYFYLIKHWLPKGSSYLDLGCGVGQTTAYLWRDGYRVKGIDISTKLINAAKNKFPEVDFAQADVLDLPFRDESFDAVGSNNVIEHISDVSKFLQEQIRVVKKGGLIFIVGPNLLSPQVPIKSLLLHQRRTHEGCKSLAGLIKIFFRNIILIFIKKINPKCNFIYRQLNLQKVWPDYDACYQACPLDIKKFFKKYRCRILCYQFIDWGREDMSILKKLGSLFLPEWMGLIRIVVKKE